MPDTEPRALDRSIPRLTNDRRNLSEGVHIEGMAAALVSIAPSDVVTGVRAISAHDMGGLDATELAVVAKAVERRRHEFATGRALLRQLMESRQPIAVGRSRAPELPSGWVGSLAHDRAIAVAAVSQSPSVAALGIDVEPDEPLPADIARVVLRPEERRLDAHLAFTLKEAAYKAWSSTGGEILDHHDVRLELDGRRFRAVVIAAQRPIDGVFTTVSGRHLALAVVRRR